MNQLALGSVGLRNIHLLRPALLGIHNHGKHTGNLADSAVQRQLADKNLAFQLFRFQNSAAGHEAYGNRQVKAAALLTQIGGCQINRNPRHREGIIGITQRRLHALLGLAHGHRRQSHQIKAGQAVAHVHLNQNLYTINTTSCFAKNLCKHYQHSVSFKSSAANA